MTDTQESDKKKTRNKPPRNIQLKASVPKGPYPSQATKWDAILKYLAVKSARFADGYPKISNREVEKWMGLTPDEIAEEETKPGFRQMKLARNALLIQSSISEMAPQIGNIINDVISNAQTDKDKREALELIGKISNTYGLNKIDTSLSNEEDGLNVEEAVAEGVGIIKDLTGFDVPVQKFIKRCVDGPSIADEGGSDEGAEAIVNSGTASDGSNDRPNKAVDTVPVPEKVTV